MNIFTLAVQPDIKGAEDQMRFAVIAGIILIVFLVIFVFYLVVREAVRAGTKDRNAKDRPAKTEPHGFPVATQARKRYDA